MNKINEIMENVGVIPDDHELKTCDVCGGKLETIIIIGGKKRLVPCMCECQEKVLNGKRAMNVQKEKQNRINRMTEWSIMDRNFKNCTLENFKVESKSDARNKKIAEKYIANFGKMKEENVGLLMHGEPGNGKTFTASVIANELMKDFVSVIAININGYISKLKSGFNSYNSEPEYQIIKKINEASLLILDDLGAENSTEWAKSKIYELIDDRYRTGKPIIITTNLNLNQLEKQMTKDDGVKRVFDRIMEMTVSVQIKGESKREVKAKNKRKTFMSILES